MAAFNQPYEKKQEETYLNYSRGADAPSPLRTPIAKESSNAVANFGNIGIAAVNAKDMLYQERIRKELTTDVDNIRDAWIGASTSSGSPNANVPADLTRQMERIQALTESSRGGELSDKAYWMQLENIARATRGRYPGYREYIDNVISDLTGGTPANVLQRAVVRDAADARDSASKQRDQLVMTMVREGTYSMLQNPDAYTTQELMWFHSKNMENKFRSERRRADLAERSATMELDQKEVFQTASEEIYRTIPLARKELVDQFYRAQANAIPGSTGQPLTGKAYEEAAAAGAQLKIANQQLVNSILDQYPMLRTADRQALMKQQDEEIDLIVSNILSGDATSLDIIANRNKIMSEQDDYAILMQDPSDNMRVMAAIKRQIGDVGVQERFNAVPRDMNSRAKFMAHDFILSQHPESKKRVSITEQGDRIAKDPKIGSSDKAAALNSSITQSINNLSNPNIPVQERINTARSLFGQGNENFLKRIYSGDDITAFQVMNSPEVVKAIAELSKHDRNIKKEYDTWKALSFKYLYDTELNTMKSIVVDRASMDLQLLDDGTIQLNRRDMPGIGIGAGGPGAADAIWEAVASWWSGASTSVDVINATINGMRPGWEAEGKDPKEETLKLLTMSGVDLNAEKTPFGPTSLFAAFGEFLMSSVRSMSDDVNTFLKSENRLSDDPFLADLEGLIEFARSHGYQPGQRESTNIEDRRGESSGLLRAGENFQVPNERSSDGLASSSIEDNLRAVFGDRAP